MKEGLFPMESRLLCRSLVLAVSLSLVACSAVLTSKRDILQQAAAATTKADLLRLVGPPDDVTRLGPFEQWTYDARDGQVTFGIVGDQVTLEATDSLLQ